MRYRAKHALIHRDVRNWCLGWQRKLLDREGCSLSIYEPPTPSPCMRLPACFHAFARTLEVNAQSNCHTDQLRPSACTCPVAAPSFLPFPKLRWKVRHSNLGSLHAVLVRCPSLPVPCMQHPASSSPDPTRHTRLGLCGPPGSVQAPSLHTVQCPAASDPFATFHPHSSLRSLSPSLPCIRCLRRWTRSMPASATA